MHTGNLPEDRGGSPIQNQILKGVNFTKVSAIQMQNPLDSGAIYCSKKVSLQGSLNDIMMMLTKACVDLIIKCVTKNPTAVNQKGVPTYNKRKYDNSIKFNCSIEEIYDQIRMLDGDDYPKTHIDFEGFRFEFTRASLSGESILSDVKIFKHQK
jgi:methionyl-tRNA formyltransferase